MGRYAVIRLPLAADNRFVEELLAGAGAAFGTKVPKPLVECGKAMARGGASREEIARDTLTYFLQLEPTNTHVSYGIEGDEFVLVVSDRPMDGLKKLL